jgi:chemotaxis protein MotB
MSAVRRHRKHHHEEHENHERWLVSGYDMMTLLFAVFVVLFAISSTNVSKVKLLQQSLQEAFSGPVLAGGRAMMQTGDRSAAKRDPAPAPPMPALAPREAVAAAMTDARDQDARAEAAVDEERSFQDLKRRIDQLVAEEGLGRKVATTVTPDGLRIRLLTDRLFFDSGSAAVNAAAVPLLDRIGGVIAQEARHPVAVEGHTDDRPIATAQFPSNWQLSGDRAAAVVQRLAGSGVTGKRLSLAGHADSNPVADNDSAGGRAQNRRVEILLTRLHEADPRPATESPSTP